jgi:HAMP domain-containing protein
MKRFAIPVLAVAAVVMAATVMLRSPSTRIDLAAEATAMMPIREMHAKIDLTKLPADEFEDQALVFPTTARH